MAFPNAHEFAGNVTCHGLRNLDEAKRFRKIIWLTFVLSCVGFLAYNMFLSIREYLEFPTVLQITVESRMDQPFPAVTICNFNKYDYQRAEQVYFELIESSGLNVSMDVFTHYINEGLRGVDYSNPRGPPNIKQFTEIEVALSDEYSDFRAFMDTISFQLDEILSGHIRDRAFCRNGGRASKECRESDFSVVYSRYGRCFQYRQDVQISPGAGQGFFMTYDTRQDINREASFDRGEAAKGVVVLPHLPMELPNVESLGALVGPGQIARIAMSHQKLRRQPKPWGTCINDNEAEKKFNFYTVENCKMSLLMDYFLAECKCLPIQLLIPESMHGDQMMKTPYATEMAGLRCCGPLDVVKCTQPKYTAYSDILRQRKANEMDDVLCAPACVQHAFDFSISTASFPTQAFTSGFINLTRQSAAYVNSNLLALDVFYKTHETSIREDEIMKSFVDILADLGGMMGLCLGMSLLTVMEFVEFLFDLVFYGFCRRRPAPRDPRGTGGFVNPTPQNGSAAARDLELARMNNNSQLHNNNNNNNNNDKAGRPNV